jgi:hypothetical protein
MRCDKCGFENADDLKYCGNCGNKIIIIETDKYLKSNLEIKNPSVIVKNYRAIFNVFFYTVTVFFVLYLLSGMSIPAVLLGHLLNVLLNPFTWAFYVLIVIFKKNPRRNIGILSIIFGSLNIFFVIGQIFILGQ